MVSAPREGAGRGQSSYGLCGSPTAPTDPASVVARQVRQGPTGAPVDHRSRRNRRRLCGLLARRQLSAGKGPRFRVRPRETPTRTTVRPRDVPGKAGIRTRCEGQHVYHQDTNGARQSRI